MDSGEIELPLGRIEGELAIHVGALELDEGKRSRFARRAHERDRHFVRHVEVLDQDSFVPLQSGRILDEDLGEFVEARVMHRALRFHRQSGMQPDRPATRSGLISPRKLHRSHPGTEAPKLVRPISEKKIPAR